MAEIAAASLRSLFQSPGGGGGVGGSILGGLTQPGRGLLGCAGAGDRRAGAPGAAICVGERGPELFVPSASGRIEQLAAAAAARSAWRSRSRRRRPAIRRCCGNRRGRWRARCARRCRRNGDEPLVHAGRARRSSSTHVKRFDPRHWTVDFPRPSMASVVTTPDGHGLTVEASFLHKGDLVGLI